MNHYWREPLEMFMIWKGGLAWQGSFLAGFASGVIYLRRKKIPVRPFLDLVAVYIALGHAIGRVGCFLNGCCYGKPADWGIYFPVWQERLQPTQLYMVAGQLAIFMILRGIVPLKRYPGQVFVWYLLLSSLERFLVEFARADHELYAGLSIFQYVSLAIFLWALLLNAWWVRRAGKR
jgi:phosphatidylglycerol:prolipoprotein diacylglycerol transferase